jgi:hypothetical protein
MSDEAVETTMATLGVQRGVAQMIVGMAQLAKNMADGTSTLTVQDAEALGIAFVELATALHAWVAQSARSGVRPPGNRPQRSERGAPPPTGKIAAGGPVEGADEDAEDEYGEPIIIGKRGRWR